MKKLSTHKTAFALLAASVTLLAGATTTRAVSIYGLADNNRLIRFDSGAPGSTTANHVLTGLGSERLLGIDYRPGTTTLYGVSDANRIYTINPLTGTATAVGAGTFSPGITGGDFGFDFNPTVDRIRLVSDTAGNLRLNPNDGSLTATDGRLAYAAGDSYFGIDPVITGVGYTPQGVLYAIDSMQDTLVRIDPANAGVLQTIGLLGFNTTGAVGLDFFGFGNTLFASLTSPTAGSSTLFTINAQTGRAGVVGNIEAGVKLKGIAVTPVSEPATLVFTAALVLVGFVGHRYARLRAWQV